MLAIITGDRQVGKTRWLERFIEAASGAGMNCIGLISPGRWVEGADGGLEKTGIQAVLLPQNEELPYAVRPDLVSDESGQFTQSDKVQLGWKVYDEAIEKINDHFDALKACTSDSKDLLIIDEIGPLELVHGTGFVSALDMLDHPTVSNAVIIMRPELLRTIIERLTPAWDEPFVITISTDHDYRGIESLIKSFSSASDRSY